MAVKSSSRPWPPTGSSRCHLWRASQKVGEKSRHMRGGGTSWGTLRRLPFTYFIVLERRLPVTRDARVRASRRPCRALRTAPLPAAAHPHANISRAGRWCAKVLTYFSVYRVRFMTVSYKAVPQPVSDIYLPAHYFSTILYQLRTCPVLVG